MSELSDSGSSGLSDGWAVVSALGELEDREADSSTSTSSSSIEVVQREGESEVPDESTPDDPASQSTSSECTELEQLMKKADAAAAAASDAEEAGSSEPVAAEIGTTSDVDVGHFFNLPPLSAQEEEPLDAYHLRRESTGEEEVKTRTTTAQPSPDRGSYTGRAFHSDRGTPTEAAIQTDQASQTERASPVLPDRRMSLTSLWSFSSKSSSEDTSSTGCSDFSFAGSADADSDGHELSTETNSDSEPEFVCLETEASSSCTQSTEGLVTKSGVKARTGSRSSVGSEFSFLSGGEDFVPLSISADAESLPPQLVQENHHQQGQLLPQSLTSSRFLAFEEWLPAPDLPRERAFPVEEAFTDQQEVEASVLQHLPPARLVDGSPTVGGGVELRRRTSCRLSQSQASVLQHLPPARLVDSGRAVGDGVELGRRASCRLSQSSPKQVKEENDEVSPAVENLHLQNPPAEGDMLAVNTHCRHLRLQLIHHIKRWFGGGAGLVLGALLMWVLAFELGHWMGAQWGQSKQLESQVSCIKQLHLAQDELQQCMFQRLHFRKECDASYAMERRFHERTVTDLQSKLQRLAKHLKDAEQRVEELMTGSNPHLQDSVGSASPKDAERQRRNKRPGQKSKDSDDQQRADTLRHLYFSMREEREIGMNTSDYLQYLTQHMNMSTFLHYLAHYWNASKNWTESVTVDMSLWMPTLLQLPEKAVLTVPSMWNRVISTLSHTYEAFAKNLYRSAKDQSAFAKNLHRSAKDQSVKTDGKGNMKGRENVGWEEGELDEEVRIEVEEESEIESEDYNDWEVKRHKTGGNRAEEEHEYIDIDAFDDVEEEYAKSKAEDETHHNHRHRSGIMYKIFKKTGKALSRVGKRLQNTWNKVKDMSSQLWSEKSALGRMAARVTNSVNRFSSKLQKKVHRWLKKRSKGKKHPEPFHKHERKKTHAHGDQDWKKSGHRHNKTQHSTTSDKLHENGKDKQKFDKPGEVGRNKYQSEKYGSKGKKERTSEGVNGDGVKQEKFKKVGKEKITDNPDKQIKDRKRGSKEKSEKDQKKTQKHGQFDRRRKNEKSVNKTDGQDNDKPTSSRRDQDNKLDKSDRKIRLNKMKKQEKNVSEIDSNKNERFDEGGGNNVHEERSETLNQIKKTRSDQPSDFQNREEENPTDHHTLSSPAVARIKFRLQSHFQELFSKVGSMDKEAFRSWSTRDISKMVEDVLTVAQRYNSKLHLGLPASGSQWLKCQHGFWVGALSHHIDYKPAQSCFRFLAPWQITVLEEVDDEISVMEGIKKDSKLAGNKNDGAKSVFTPADHINMDDVDVSAADEDDFGDDCHVYPDRNSDDEYDNSGDDEIQERLPEGEREEFEKTNSPTKTTQAKHSQQPLEENKQLWYISRAEGRNNLRSEDHKADWVFERAIERDEARREHQEADWVFEHKADWVFERAAERLANRQKKREDSQGQRKQKPEPQYTQDSRRKKFQYHKKMHEHSGDNEFEYQDRRYRRKYGHASFCLFC